MRAVVSILLLASGLALSSSAAPEPQTITRHYTPADQKSGRYQYVPFEVPAGATELRVSYRYDRANGENVVDLGVFAPGSLDLGTAAFRGYSGGNKEQFTIGPEQATDGYIPGPLPAGTWHLMLGLYRVGEAGVDVTMDIATATTTTTTVPGTARPPAPPPGHSPARTSKDGWYMGALHTHTLHSDGTVKAVDLLSRFGEAGFDFVAITDHNNTTHTFELGLPHASNRPLWIIGEEVTTPGGHASVWGLRPGGWVDFRVPPGDPRITDLVESAKRQGGVFSVNHPVATCLACGWDHAFVDGISALEISNGRHGEVERALALWDQLLVGGRRITGVGSSDWHSAPSPIDVANVRVRAPALTEAAILDAIRAGHVIVVNGAHHPTPTVTARAGNAAAGVGETLRVAAGTPIAFSVHAPGLASGRAHVVENGAAVTDIVLDAEGRGRFTRPAAPGYVRVEFYDSAGAAVAYANPIYTVQP